MIGAIAYEDGQAMKAEAASQRISRKRNALTAAVQRRDWICHARSYCPRQRNRNRTLARHINPDYIGRQTETSYPLLR